MIFESLKRKFFCEWVCLNADKKEERSIMWGTEGLTAGETIGAGRDRIKRASLRKWNKGKEGGEF